MKAYVVRDEQRYEDYCTIVFAETRGQARQIAQSTDACEDSEFTDIRALRVPELDRFYRGNQEMDWHNMADRVAMVRYGNMFCSYEVDAECEDCDAKEYCDRYESEHEEDYE